MLVTEDELNARFKTRKKLESEGDYGLGCLVFEGSLPSSGGKLTLDDHHVRTLMGKHDGDVGTILINGDLEVDGHICVSDRLMCLIVTGNLVATEMSIFETEVLVYGTAEIGTLVDRDKYLKVLKRKTGPAVRAASAAAAAAKKPLKKKSKRAPPETTKRVTKGRAASRGS